MLGLAAIVQPSCSPDVLYMHAIQTSAYHAELLSYIRLQGKSLLSSNKLGHTFPLTSLVGMAGRGGTDRIEFRQGPAKVKLFLSEQNSLQAKVLPSNSMEMSQYCQGCG